MDTNYCYRKIINNYNLPIYLQFVFLILTVNSHNKKNTKFSLVCQMAPLNKRKLRFKGSLTIGDFEVPTNKENSTTLVKKIKRNIYCMK